MILQWEVNQNEVCTRPSRAPSTRAGSQKHTTARPRGRDVRRHRDDGVNKVSCSSSGSSSYPHCQGRPFLPWFLPTLALDVTNSHSLHSVVTQHKSVHFTGHLLKQPDVYLFHSAPNALFQHIPAVLSGRQAGGMPNFKCLECGKRCLPTAPFLSPTG